MARSSLMHTGETAALGTQGPWHRRTRADRFDRFRQRRSRRFGFRARERLGLTPDPAADGDTDGHRRRCGSRPRRSRPRQRLDRTGTGERASAGRDTAAPVDQTLYDDEGNAVEGEDLADDSSLDATLQARTTTMSRGRRRDAAHATAARGRGRRTRRSGVRPRRRDPSVSFHGRGASLHARRREAAHRRAQVVLVRLRIQQRPRHRRRRRTSPRPARRAASARR